MMFSSKHKNVRPVRLSRQSPKFLRNQKVRNAWTAGLVLVSLVACGFALSRLSALNFFTVQNIKIAGADADIEGSLRAAALDALQGKYLGAISKSNVLFYPRQTVIDAVTNASKRLLKVNVAASGLQSLKISVIEKSPAALICANLPDWEGSTLVFDESDNCFYTDDAGVIYQHAPPVPEHFYNRYYLPDIVSATTSEAMPVAVLATTSPFVALQKFYSDVRDHGINVQAILTHTNGEYELYASNPDINIPRTRAASSTTNTVVIYFNDHNGLQNELSNLVSFWSNMLARAKAKGQELQFDSIDVRYGSNVFYRLSSH